MIERLLPLPQQVFLSHHVHQMQRQPAKHNYTIMEDTVRAH